jgi:hypothetical protein
MGRLLLPRRGLLRLAAPTLLLPRLARAQFGGLLPLRSPAASGGGPSTWVLKSSGTITGSPSGNASSSAFNGTGVDLIILTLAYFSTNTVIAGTDSVGGNTWQTAVTQTGQNPACSIFYTHNPNVSSSMTVGYISGGGNTFGSCEYYAFSGSSAGAPLDVTNSASTVSGNTLQPGSITTSQNNELIATALSDGASNLGTDSINNSFIGVLQVPFGGGNNYGGAGAYLVQTTAGALTGTTWTSFNTPTCACIASFKSLTP